MNARIKMELFRIKKVYGNLSVNAVLKEAQNKNSPLHQEFEWDDSIAGEAWRHEQARRLICAHKALITIQKKTTVQMEARVWLSKGQPVGHYDLRKVVLSRQQSRSHFIRHKLSILVSWCGETADVRELQGIRSVIVAELKKLKVKVPTPKAPRPTSKAKAQKPPHKKAA